MTTPTRTDRPASTGTASTGTAPTVQQLAWGFSVGLAAARVGAGLLEVVAPGTFLGLIGTRHANTASARAGFRMKGGRDLGVGMATLLAARRGDVAGVRAGNIAAVAIDVVDGLTVASEDGAETFRFPIHPAGSWLGYAVSVAAAAAVAVLPTPARNA